MEHAELILVIGSNPTGNHPVAATWMKNAAKRGTKIVLADPRRTDLGRHAWRTLQFKPDTDVALLNAMIHTVIDEGLADEAFVAQRASNFEALRENVEGYSPEAMAPICGIPAETMREVARAFATAKGAMILWGMGISQHVHGTDNARCLIALCSCDRPDRQARQRPASAARPEQRAGRQRRRADPDDVPELPARGQRRRRTRWFEKFWGTHARRQARLHRGRDHGQGAGDDSDPHKVRGMYIMGENPAMTRPGPEPRARGAGARSSTWWCRTSS